MEGHRIHLSSPGSQPFSTSLVDKDEHSARPGYSSGPRFDTSPHASSSRQPEKQDEPGSSNFLNVLKERVQAVLDVQHPPTPRTNVGSVSQPATLHELSPSSQQNSRSLHGGPVSPSMHQQSRDLQMLPLQSGHEPVVFDSGSDNGVRTASLEDYYSIDWVPKELVLKFRQQVEGYQIGANFEVKDYNTKLVFKPTRVDKKWKFIYEPKYGDVRLLTKKIPIGPLLNLQPRVLKEFMKQVGIGHDLHSHTTGWKWKVTSAFGGSGQTQLRHKTLLPLTPGFDLRVGWNAEYVLPDLHGALGTGDPAIGLNLGHLYASIDRVEAIYTHMT